MTGAGQESLSPWGGRCLGPMRAQTWSWLTDLVKLPCTAGKPLAEALGWWGRLKQCDPSDRGSIHGGRLTGLVEPQG